MSATDPAGYRPRMQLSPRYDGPPLLRDEAPPADAAVPLLRQRRRLAAALAGLEADQWLAPSRCEGWAVRDVAAHLVSADQFWALAARSALAGEPTRFLQGFDPVATPPALIAGNEAPPEQLVADLRASTDALEEVLGGLDAERWETPAEAPPGLVPLHALATHALWDGWVHERDVLVPLGIAPAEEPDELLACLRYVAALGPAFLATMGSTRTATLVVEGTDPDARVVVEAGETVVLDGTEPPADVVRLEGRTLDLVEGLSRRAPLPHDVPPAARWLVEGLAITFDQAPPA